jgi:hypothetical protein
LEGTPAQKEPYYWGGKPAQEYPLTSTSNCALGHSLSEQNRFTCVFQRILTYLPGNKPLKIINKWTLRPANDAL